MIRKFLLGLMIASVASLAWAGIPDANQSEVWVGEQGTAFTDCGARFSPDGTGVALENAYRLGQGLGHECRIWVQVRNSAGNPIPLTPGDVWLEWGGSITLCSLETQDYALAMPQGAFPGLFYFEGTRAAGGYGNFHKIFVLGTELTAQAEIMIISPDITGDFAVDGLDVTPIFASWGANYHYRADLNMDGAVDGLDITPFFAAWGSGCP